MIPLLLIRLTSAAAVIVTPASHEYTASYQRTADKTGSFQAHPDYTGSYQRTRDLTGEFD